MERAALPVPAPLLLALTALRRSAGVRRAPGLAGGRRAIGSAAPHVAQPAATIGLADCLKKQGPGPREHLICFNVPSQLSLLISVWAVGRAPQSGARLETLGLLFTERTRFVTLPTIFLGRLMMYTRG